MTVTAPAGALAAAANSPGSVCAGDALCMMSRWPVGAVFEDIFGLTADDVWFVGGSIVHWDGTAMVGQPMPLPTPAVLRRVHASSRDNVWAVGDAGLIVRWDGQQWSQVPAPIGDVLLDVWTFSPVDVFVITEGYAWHYDGNGWTRLDSPTPPFDLWGSPGGTLYLGTDPYAWSPAIHRLVGTSWQRVANVGGSVIWGTADDDIYAAGGRTLWHFDGSNWTSEPIPTTYTDRIGGSMTGDLYIADSYGFYHKGGDGWIHADQVPNGARAVALTAPTDGWVQSEGKLYRRNGPTTWAVFSSRHMAVPAIWGASDDDLWVGKVDGLLHWDGTSFLQTPMLGTRPAALWGSSSTDVWLWSDFGLLKRYNGQSWTSVPGAPDAEIIHGFSADDVWVFAGRESFHYTGTWASKGTVMSSDIRDVDGQSSVDVWAAGGGCGYATSGMVSHWDGVRWRGVHPLVGACGIHQSSTDDVWAVGSEGRIARWDGTSWHDLLSPTLEDLYDVWGSAPDNVWAVGGNGVLLHFDGSDWYPVPSGTAETLKKIWGDTAGNLWVVGTNLFRRAGSAGRPSRPAAVAASTVPWTCEPPPAGAGAIDGGVPLDAGTPAVPEWAVGEGQVLEDGWRYELPRPSSQPLADIDGWSASDVWAVGPAGTVLHFDGTSWRSVPTPFSADLKRAHAWTSGRVIVVSREDDPWEFDGLNWQRMQSPFEAGLTQTVWKFADDDIWMVGPSVSHWNGTEWTTTDLPPGPFYAAAPDDVWITDDNAITHWRNGQRQDYAVSWGGGPIHGCSASDVWIGATNDLYHWDGQDLLAVQNPTAPMKVRCIAENNVLLDGARKLYRWNGLSWTLEWERLDFEDRVNALWADATSGWMHNSDGTWSWTATGGWAPVLRSPGVTDVAGIDENNAVAIATGGRMLEKKNGEWHETTLAGKQLKSIAMVSPDLIYIGTQSGFIKRDPSGLTHIVTGYGGANAIVPLAENDIYYASVYGYLEHWDGTEWSYFELSPSSRIKSVWGLRPEELWLTSEDDVLWRFDSVNATLAQHGVGQVHGSRPWDVWVSGEHLRHFDGSRWAYTPLPNNINVTPGQPVAVIGINPGLAFASTTDGWIHRWNGSVWRRATHKRLTADPIQRFSLAPDGTLYAVTTSGSVLSRRNLP